MLNNSLFIILAFLAGCAAEYSPREKLLHNTARYYDAFRWNKIENMREFVPPAGQAVFKEEFCTKYNDVMIVDYEVTDIEMDKSKKSARVTLSFSWHPIDETIIREVVVVDIWKLHKTQWYRESQEVVSGEAP